MPRHAVVFDLDGTLVDSRQDIALACNRMLTALHRDQLSEETIANFVGDGARRLVSRALEATASSQVEDVDIEHALQVFLDAYAAEPTGHTRLMPGAREALDALSDLPLAVCTNKARCTTDLVLDALDLSRHFQHVVAGDDLAHHKPHPEPLQHLAQRLGVSPQRLVMVGDGPQDVECGRAVGAYTVGVKGGVLPLERLLASNPDTLLDSLHELPPLVRRLVG